MRCLFLHCRRFDYKLDHPTVAADGVPDGEARHFEEVMVVFTAIENGDDDGKINAAAKEIRKLARRVKAERIVINPFAHLSESLAEPAVAKELLKILHTRLRDTWTTGVEYTSFGWYKEFYLSVYGHEGSQVFRQF